MKAYQLEVDSLTKRNKFADSCFLNAYKALASVPDPLILLHQAQATEKQLNELKISHEKMNEHSGISGVGIKDVLSKNREELEHEYAQKEILYKERFISFLF